MMQHTIGYNKIHSCEILPSIDYNGDSSDAEKNWNIYIFHSAIKKMNCSIYSICNGAEQMLTMWYSLEVWGWRGLCWSCDQLVFVVAWILTYFTKMSGHNCLHLTAIFMACLTFVGAILFTSGALGQQLGKICLFVAFYLLLTYINTNIVLV